jgi:Tfp pilus assembly protein PilF
MMKSKNTKTYNYSRVAACLVLVFILLILGAAFYPTGWNWGFHFLAFYGLETKIVVPFLILLFIIPAVQNFFINKISLFAQWFSRQNRYVRFFITITALSGLVLIFWIFRVTSYFLGDGQLILRNMQNLGSADQFVFGYQREPLVGFCIVLLTNFFIVLKRLNPTLDAYTWLSIFSGVIFAVAAWKFVKYYAEERTEQYLLFFLLITTGVSQLFFGYIENYTLSSAGVLIFLLLGISYLKGNISVVWVTVIYGVTFILHFGTLIFLPALTFLFYIAVKRKQAGELAASIFLTGVIVYALLQLSQYPLELMKDVLGGSGQHIVTFSLPLGKNQAYDFISSNHVLDVVNFFFLSYPAITILLILSSIMTWGSHRTINNETIFLLFSGFCGSIFIMVLNCDIGMSRDWDIIAPMSLGIPIVAIALWSTIEQDGKFKNQILIMLCVVSLIHTGLWVGVNADETKAEKRFAILADSHLWSKTAHLDAYEELAVYYREQGNYEKVIHYYREYAALDSSNNRILKNLEDAIRRKKTIRTYETMVHSGKANFQILSDLGVLYAEDKRFSEAMTVFKRAEEEAPLNPIVKYNIGTTFIEGERAYDKAIPYYLQAIQLDSLYSQAYYKAAQCYFMIGDSINAHLLMIQLQNLVR